jgi:hypothetical protein
MARSSFTPQDLQKIRDLAAQWGKIVARHAFADQGPGTDVDLTTMEEVALAAAAGLTEGTLTTLVEQQAQQLGSQQACPACGRLCPVRRAARPLDVRGGSLQLSEPTCHCPNCRRDFFPPTAATPPGQPSL